MVKNKDLPSNLTYEQGCWDTLTYVLNYLNAIETKKVEKKKLYGDLLDFRPEHVYKSCRS